MAIPFWRFIKRLCEVRFFPTGYWKVIADLFPVLFTDSHDEPSFVCRITVSMEFRTPDKPSASKLVLDVVLRTA